MVHTNIPIVPWRSAVPPGVFRWGLLFALSCLLSACVGQPSPAVRSSPTVRVSPEMDTGAAQASPIEASLRNVYADWRGTRHRMGGTSRRGVDCSGFVWAVYRNVFQMNLPRTTARQIKIGAPVSRYALQPGDLVFFQPPGYARHVGIYITDDRFLHASKSRGVTISTIDDRYWEHYFRTARRVLPTRR